MIISRTWGITLKPRKSSHSVFSIRLHMVFVTHYRKKVLTKAMLIRLRAMLEQISKKLDCYIVEFNGEPDHIHILLDFQPKNAVSTVVACLKSSTSRMLKKEFPQEIKKSYWGNVSFWSGSYYVSSTGGATIEKLKE